MEIMNVLYIDCDSLRPDHLGCYGYHRDTSPTIDGLAADGRRFTDYYAADVPCLPSRTGLFLGRFGFNTGVVNHGGAYADARNIGPDRGGANNERHRTWMTAMREAGYHTAFVSPFPQRHGAWHVLDGFNEWIDTGGGGSDRADVVTAHAVEWLESQLEGDDGEDWHLHVNYWDPHTHYDTPESYGNPFADDPAPEWPPEDTIAEQYESYGTHSARDLHHGYLTGTGAPDDLPRVPDEIEDRADFERWIDGYDVGIRYMDDHIADLLAVLEAAGVREDTLVIVSADHGENQGELNVYGDHQTADYWTCRVPLIVSGPGVEPGVDEDLHYQLDLPPTMVDLVDGDVPGGWDGTSFAQSLKSGDKDGRDRLVLSQGTWACQRAARWEDWLLIRTHHDGLKSFDPVELYDLAADPHETENLARDHPDVVSEGLAIIDDWRDRRLADAAIGRDGGIPDAHEALVDPLFGVIREGGPHYTDGNEDVYAERLRETGRPEHAEAVERRKGVVERGVASYLDGAHTGR